ncbi:hypothetical protein E2C01_092236 [Portunus trituberculatus]|uniref:Uncharacterized protein n=1 Tax=Portunus trituberculatus TaxID=210409 RepID=A0A5B7JR76_PORTR|nr:hypothetical protein [Portunus trituberculatus]
MTSVSSEAREAAGSINSSGRENACRCLLTASSPFRLSLCSPSHHHHHYHYYYYRRRRNRFLIYR